MAKTVFYSFHYQLDLYRVQLVRQIGALEGQPILNAQDWEQVRRRGSEAIKSWIDEQMSYKKAVVVLVGKETAGRPWVKYEIERAWYIKKPLLGIRIHGLSSMGSASRAGANPFTQADIESSRVPLFDPTVPNWQGRTDTRATYSKLSQNLELWSGKGVTR